MDPSKFPVSTTPLNHEPYGPLTEAKTAGINKGKLAVVTGAARGIGRAIAIALAKSGANLALLDVNLPGLRETASLCSSHDIKAKIWECDLTAEGFVEHVFREIFSDLGHIDILVNNAGKFLARPQSMASFGQYWSCFEANMKSTMICTFKVLPGMRHRGSGCIINIASRAATVDTPMGLGYNDAKAAVTRATSCLQLELDNDGLGEKIHCYALHPGGVPTDMGASAHSQQDVIEQHPELTEASKEFVKLFKDPPELCGQTCAYLASGQAKEIRGCYFDCRQDIEKVKGLGRERIDKEGLYNLRIEFMEGYSNEP